MITKLIYLLLTIVFLIKPIEAKEILIQKQNPKQIEPINIENVLIEYYKKIDNQLKTETKNQIKKREGVRLKPYKCPAGQWTIGYGHLIKKKESHLLNRISYTQADSLLESDINIISKYLKRNYNLKGYRLYSMTAFSFNLGMYYIKVKKSCKLDSLIKNNKPIDSEILKYCHYKNPKTKKYIRNENLYKARLWELNFYNKHDSIINILKNS